jgi:hypothetical protein
LMSVMTRSGRSARQCSPAPSRSRRAP